MRLTRRRRKRPEAGPVDRCAWCGQGLGEGEVFGFGARAHPGVDLRPHRGQVIQIALSSAGRTAPTLVVGLHSPAAREGHDLYFVTCTETCLRALKTALQAEIEPQSRGPGPAARATDR
jgi:hypothetical protein